MPTSAPDFQTIIFNLQTYWANQGCIITEPYYSQVGAGTMNPSTFLRVLGPEPWNVAYVEPSVRPDDGRYGINPNRLQQHHQFQVILKPDPGNPQELYLQSLLALGIDPKEHDIRFVEDNWESPALSAWGLGWEVWLDGQEITQFTYFQQAGGVVLDVPAVELTYGLERIAMTLQQVRHFKDIRWNNQRTYGDLLQIAEREHSTYYYEVADVERQREIWNDFSQEAELALSKRLVLPAYDNVIKCSHVFNVMDARGAIGFTERQALFGKMRDLSKRVAEAYLKQREELGFPWLKNVQPSLALDPQPLPEVPGETADLLFEIGTEELPVSDLDAAIPQLEEALKKFFADTRLEYESLSVQGTPRRLTAMVAQLRTRQMDRDLEIKGPPADRAFDEHGQPTQVAIGFARSKGLDLGALKVKDNYVVANIAEKGQTAMALLSEALPGIIGGIKFGKAMRWNASGKAYSRPIRWLVALLGEQVVPFTFADVPSGRTTHGMRFSAKPTHALSEPAEYLPYLHSEGILLNNDARRDTIWQQALALAQKTGGTLQEDRALLEEVTNLVERPTAILGSFSPKYLETLPPEVLIGVMKKHQRYFPVLDESGQLMPYFVVIRNGDSHGVESVIDGNEQVVLARFADAEFFIKEDYAKALAEFVPGLAQLTFQKQLGSMLDKTDRVRKLAGTIGVKMELSPVDLASTLRAAELAKADLASSMVVEMTSLQGVMGKYYALRSGEDEAVAQGIFEHYLPRFAGDALPEGLPGIVVGIADRLDSIAGLFAVGLAPTGNKDPFALRRSALGLAQVLIGKHLDFDLKWGLEQAGKLLPVALKPEVQQAALDFSQSRLRGLLLDAGARYDVVDAALAAQGANPARTSEAVKTLAEWVGREDWADILAAYSRSVRITRDLKEQFTVDKARLSEAEEVALARDLERAEQQSAKGFEGAMKALEDLVPAITAFFDKVLVMDPDETVRQNRLALLQKVAGLIKPYADLSKLEGF